MFEGIYAALLTPCDEAGDVDEPKLRALVDFLVGKSISGLYICGNTGQGVYFSVAERMRIAEVVKEQVAGRAEIISHIACISTRDTKALVDHAGEIGLDAVSSLSPIYWGYSDGEVVQYYRDIMADAKVPCMMYIKAGAGAPEMEMSTILEVAKVPGVVGMKYTSANFYKMQNIMQRLGSDFMVLSGPDELFLPALTMGVRGSIGTTHNVFPELFQAIRRHFKAGEIAKAMAVQEVVTRIVTLYSPYGSHVTAQTLLTLRGLELGLCRKPVTPRVPEAAVKALLDKARAFIAACPEPIALEG